MLMKCLWVVKAEFQSSNPTHSNPLRSLSWLLNKHGWLTSQTQIASQSVFYLLFLILTFKSLQNWPWFTSCSSLYVVVLHLNLSSYHILSVGGGGMFTARVPANSRTSTVSSKGVLDISSNFFLMNSFSVALWKYLDLAILSTNLKIFFPVFPPPVLWKRIRGEEGVSMILHLDPDLVLRRWSQKFAASRDCWWNEIRSHLERDVSAVKFSTLGKWAFLNQKSRNNTEKRLTEWLCLHQFLCLLATSFNKTLR